MGEANDVGSRRQELPTGMSEILAPLKPPSLLRNFRLDPQDYPNTHHRDGVPGTLNGRTARSPPIDSATDKANNPSATRDTPAPTQATLHLHPAYNPLRRKLLHSTDDQPTACIQERKRHTELAAMEPEFAKAVERRGGRGRKIGRLQSQVWARMGCREGC